MDFQDIQEIAKTVKHDINDIRLSIEMQEQYNVNRQSRLHDALQNVIIACMSDIDAKMDNLELTAAILDRFAQLVPNRLQLSESEALKTESYGGLNAI